MGTSQTPVQRARGEFREKTNGADAEWSKFQIRWARPILVHLGPDYDTRNGEGLIPNVNRVHTNDGRKKFPTVELDTSRVSRWLSKRLG